MLKEKLSKKELNTLYHRYMMWYNAGSSYERYHGMGYGYALIPLFKKYYDRQGQIEGLQRHTDMHNTESRWEVLFSVLPQAWRSRRHWERMWMMS